MKTNAVIVTDTPADGSDFDAHVALFAFNGAVIGLIGLLCADLVSDRVLSSVAAAGSVVCFSIWQRHVAG